VADQEDESTLTVVVAILANFGIAVAKGIAGVLSGSAAMLSEAAHSVADTTNQGLLLVAVHRSNKPADERHPFGYGRERYFWSLLAAVGIFVGGGVFAVLQGVRELVDPGGEHSYYTLTYIVLAVSFVLESASWTQATRQLRADARRTNRSFRDQLWHTTDPAATTVFFEDSAALAGLVLAALGVGLHQATGHHQWDSIASISIGLLLTVVAFLLGKENRSLIVGEAADPRLQRAVQELLSSYDGVTSVDEVLTMVTGRGEVFIAAHLDLVDTLSAAEVEELARRMERDVKEQQPFVKHFFVDVTADAQQLAAPGIAPGIAKGE
jgi:cation diffusion facilitator family transporter